MALLLTLLLLPPLLLVTLRVRLTSHGPALYWSDRVGRGNQLFRMPKFRSMRVGTPAVATHLLGDPKAHLTPIGITGCTNGRKSGDVVQRLCGNLQVDISKARQLLGWVPPVSVDEGLRRAMAAGE